MNRNWVTFNNTSSVNINWSQVNNGESVSSTSSSISSSPTPYLSSSDSRYTAFDQIREEEQRGEYLGWSDEILEGMQRAQMDRRIGSDANTKKVTLTPHPKNEYQKLSYGLGWSSDILEGGITLKGA